MRTFKPLGRLLAALGLVMAVGGIVTPLVATTASFPMTCVACNTDGSYTCAPGCANWRWCC
jgi:hypothetical protein